MLRAEIDAAARLDLHDDHVQQRQPKKRHQASPGTWRQPAPQVAALHIPTSQNIYVEPTQIVPPRVNLLASQVPKMSERASSPTPSERARKDAEDRKREEEEQSKLPYKWTQTLEEADVNVPIPGNLKARDLIVELKKTHIKVAIKGQEPIIDVRSTVVQSKLRGGRGFDVVSCFFFLLSHTIKRDVETSIFTKR